MEQVQIPTEPAEPQPEPLKTVPGHGLGGYHDRLRMISASLTASILFAISFSYLIFHDWHSNAVAASVLPFGGGAPLLNSASLQAAVHSEPSVNSRIELSLSYIRNNQPEQAVSILNSVVADAPNNAVAWNNLCVAEIMQMDYSAAIKDCKVAIRIAPAFQLARNNLKWAEDESAKMRNSIARTEQIAPVDRDPNQYLAEGLNFLHLGNYDQAIAAWQRELEIDPTSALAANNIGTAFMFKKDPARAMSWFRKAIALDPSLQIAKNNLAWAHGKLVRPSK